MPENTGVAVQPDAQTEIETYDDLVADAGRGTEQIDNKDVRPPRLMICQAGSPQRKTDNPKQIAGLNELDLFNSLSNEIYGRSVRFVVIKSLGTHWTEFDDELNVIELNVDPSDERCQWTTDEEGNRVKPQATQFHDYLFWLPDHQEIVTFSFKSTQIGVAIQLNSLLKHPLKVNPTTTIANPPAWARTLKLETKMQGDGTYEWGGFNLSFVTNTPHPIRQMVRGFAQSYDDRNVVIDDRDIAEGDHTVEGNVASGDMPGDMPKEKIPF